MRKMYCHKCHKTKSMGGGSFRMIAGYRCFVCRECGEVK